jgi:hypothetical protein
MPHQEINSSKGIAKKPKRILLSGFAKVSLKISENDINNIFGTELG